MDEAIELTRHLWVWRHALLWCGSARSDVEIIASLQLMQIRHVWPAQSHDIVFLEEWSKPR